MTRAGLPKVGNRKKRKHLCRLAYEPHPAEAWQCLYSRGVPGLALLVLGCWWQGCGAPPAPERAKNPPEESSHPASAVTHAADFVPFALAAPLMERDQKEGVGDQEEGVGKIDFEGWALPQLEETCPDTYDQFALYEVFCRRAYNGSLASGKSLGVLNFSHAEIRSDAELIDIQLGKLEARGSKISMVSFKDYTEAAEVVIGNSDIGTLEFEDGVRIGELEVSGSSLRALELRNASVRRLTLRNCSIDSIVLSGSVVEHLEVHSVTARGTLAIEGTALGTVDIESSSFHEIEVRADDGGMWTALIDDWKMRGVQAASVELDSGSVVGNVEFDDVKATGRINVEGAQVDDLDIKASTLGRLSLDANEDQQTTVNKLTLERSQVGALDLLDATTLQGATVSESKLDTVALLGTAHANVDLKDSTVKRLELGSHAARWKGGDISTFEHERPRRGTDGSETEGTEAVKAALWHREFNQQAWTAFERQLRDEGSNREANAVHVLRLRHEYRTLEWTKDSLSRKLVLLPRAYITLDAHGDPITYLLWLFGLVFLAAGRVFTNRESPAEPPACVKNDPPLEPSRVFRLKGELASVSGEWEDKETHTGAPRDAKAETGASVKKGPHYSPFIMSLATLLPGDTFNYLRNFKFVPKDRKQAGFMIGFQLLALMLQGLVIASVALLIGK